jgi:fumarate reductase (CoM/CoB) subunit A
MSSTFHETDVLIIGAGAAGAAAAIEAGQAGVRTLVLAKGPMTMTGITPLGFTGYSAVTGLDSEDSSELHFRDTVVGGRYLCDQNLVEVMTASGAESVKKLMQYGVNFQKEKGAFLLQPAPGMSRPRMLLVPGGGKQFIDALKKEVARYPNVRVMADLTVSDLLQNGRQVVGALAFDLRTGESLVVHARATILATGGKGQLWPYTDCPPESTGDGLLLAYGAGAELIDLEQELFYPTVVIYPEHIRGLEITYETFLKPGAKILNGRGEDIVQVGDIPPTREKLANQIFKEIKEGRGTEHGGVWIDLRAASPSHKEYVQEFLPAYRRLKQFGIDITEETLEVAPAAHTSLGGVRIDADTHTSVKGLFAAGEVTGGVHGANRLAGQAWLGCIVFGSRAGKFAAAFAKETGGGLLDENSLHMAEENLRKFMAPKTGCHRPYQVLQEINRLMWEYVGLRRSAGMLQKGLARIEALREEVLAGCLKIDPTPGFNLEWAQALQVRSLIMAAEMLTRAALFREESRGTHFREDFPKQDDADWLVHTMIRKDRNTMQVGRTPVILHCLQP